MLELGERLLDWIEVGAVGRKEQKMGARASGRRVHCFGLVIAQIVHDDDVAAAERRDQLRFNIDSEGVAVDRSVQDLGSVNLVIPQSGQECGCSPLAEGAEPIRSR